METLYVDDALIVVDKPAGLPVLPDGWEPDAPFLAGLLRLEYPAADGGQSLWVVHRIDKTTSGVVMFARTAEAHRELNRQFESHEVRKQYRLILQGVPPWDERVARHPLRVDVGHKHRTAVDDRRGKPSETRFRLLERHGDFALMEAEPLTGRTHQIRVHAAALGFPLLGDELYGGEPMGLIARPALHAYRLTITHPLTGERQSFTAPYPADFVSALQQIDQWPRASR